MSKLVLPLLAHTPNMQAAPKCSVRLTMWCTCVPGRTVATVLCVLTPKLVAWCCMKLSSASVSESCACCSHRHALTVEAQAAGTSASSTYEQHKARAVFMLLLSACISPLSAACCAIVLLLSASLSWC
jgi:hypothetical protein